MLVGCHRPGRPESCCHPGSPGLREKRGWNQLCLVRRSGSVALKRLIRRLVQRASVLCKVRSFSPENHIECLRPAWRRAPWRTLRSPKKLAGRYEVREILGQGGMGLVYRAYDTVVRREVAVKTILDIPDPASLQLFYKECDVLASMSHPNIVEIFDIGEFEEEGKKKPYFVMPLLPGTTLDHFIRKASHRLTVERTVEIISQTCRGLQAAHERGLVHRDLKPSNIFVMEDDSVKIIDFGVAHMTDTHTTRAQKGTLLYMSPEQIEMKPLSAASDIFSLSVVCYEALTGRHPFQRARADEVVEAILHQIPPPASEMNSAVSQSIGRVVHKGMAKQAVASFRQCARVRRYAEQGAAQRAHRVLRSGAHPAAAGARHQGAGQWRLPVCRRNSGRVGGRRPHRRSDQLAAPAAR